MGAFAIRIMIKNIHQNKGNHVFSHGLIRGSLRDMMAVLTLTLGLIQKGSGQNYRGAQQKYWKMDFMILIQITMVFATKNAWKQVSMNFSL